MKMIKSGATRRGACSHGRFAAESVRERLSFSSVHCQRDTRTSDFTLPLVLDLTPQAQITRTRGLLSRPDYCSPTLKPSSHKLCECFNVGGPELMTSEILDERRILFLFTEPDLDVL